MPLLCLLLQLQWRLSQHKHLQLHRQHLHKHRVGLFLVYRQVHLLRRHQVQKMLLLQDLAEDLLSHLLLLPLLHPLLHSQ